MYPRVVVHHGPAGAVPDMCWAPRDRLTLLLSVSFLLLLSAPLTVPLPIIAISVVT